MNKSCQHEQKIRSRLIKGEAGDNLESHIANCAECRESQKIFDWMQNFAGQTEPLQNLPAAGLLLFKARLVKKQITARRAVQPIALMQIASIILFALAVGFVLIKARAPVVSMLAETFLSLRSVVPLVFFSLLIAAFACAAFAYFLSGAKKFKKQ
jgi:hypothetical protein